MKLLLAICQKQGTRSPYTGAGKTGGLSEYARLVGKSEGYIRQMRDAAKVFNVTQNIVLEYEVFQDTAKHLAAIHKAEPGLSEYARLVGKSQPYILQMRDAAKVYSSIKTDNSSYQFQDKAKHLAAIHKAEPGG